MPIFTKPLPLSLYIHIPWCVRKCPYCDFNSHESKGELPEDLYIQALMDDLDQHLPLIQERPLQSIFFGGGTPSLFSAQAIEQILSGTAKRCRFINDIEITMEANPGTIDQAHFADFRKAGINRLSLGIQSLQDEKLKALGRIHDQQNAADAIRIAKAAGFDNFNLDLMYGLPDQSIDDALCDLKAAIEFAPTHLSWYQLTIEPNTVFYQHTPTLPVDDLIWDMQQAGQEVIRQAGFLQYEVSAYSLPNKACRHNLNYWQFGDYLGIGAGAHSKITDLQNGEVMRFSQTRLPKSYLDSQKRIDINKKVIEDKDLLFEFMLNALRLTNGFSPVLFAERTGLPLEKINPLLELAETKQLLIYTKECIKPTELGKKFLNNLVELFLT